MSFDWQRLTQLQFWLELKEQLADIGPLLPFLLAFLESFFPILPLFVIVIFNVTVYGNIVGFLTSYIGNIAGSITVFLFFRIYVRPSLEIYAQKHPRIHRSLVWVSKQRPSVIFYLSALPFTPSSLLNIFFGCSQFSKRSYMLAIAGGKFLMIAMMAFFGYSVQEISENPVFILISVVGLIVVYGISRWANKTSGIDKL
jgi:uncharacterized membrane protein YdjX (TVP38/TMEM64 family)